MRRVCRVVFGGREGRGGKTWEGVGVRWRWNWNWHVGGGAEDGVVGVVVEEG